MSTHWDLSSGRSALAVTTFIKVDNQVILAVVITQDWLNVHRVKSCVVKLYTVCCEIVHCYSESCHCLKNILLCSLCSISDFNLEVW